MPHHIPIEVLRRCLGHARHGFTVVDARLPDQPLVYVNQAFEAMSGYSRDELIGRNCRLMQGTDRKQAGIKTIRAAREAGQPIRVTLRNYRKDGTLFWNDLSLTPIFDERGVLTHYIGVQADVTHLRKERARILRHQRQLQVLAERLIRTEAAERQKLACEVHDQVGQTLALCSMQLGELTRDLGGAQVPPALGVVCGLVEAALKEARGLMAELSPPLLRELGLEAALQNLGEQQAQRFGLVVRVNFEIGRKPVPEKVAQLVFRSARELLINVGKHAAAQVVQVGLKLEAGELVLTVEDDGKGFRTPRQVEAADGGFGLLSIRERAVYMGGGLKVRSSVGKGARVVLRLPLAQKRRRA
ncbi:MAG: PAS domain-containing protein [Opitutus sp.]|nr:PAS domain-containing protein [Opitutus sp.]MCS6246705.1 PAS domain-containing protein [Opitutus sp.]MCS6274540.1 PAS domain-containing protein [Opitutus sp.]MCS6277299.1 PAS domain-containing protein [Opitutus sp.]MCS6300421.1 PAS domain-containing protein [Opitutus sp.]